MEEIYRISLRVQSFTDAILESSERVHRRKDDFEAILTIESFFGSDTIYSMDLILPFMQEALSLNPPPNHASHFSKA